MADAGGAGLGIVLGELSKAVVDAISRAAMFKTNFKRMESILASIIPIFQDIEKLNEELNCRKEETAQWVEHIKQGPELVSKCSKISWWNFCKKFQYTDELLNLENSLKDFQFVMQAQQSRDIKEIRRGMEKGNDILRGMEEVMESCIGIEEGKDISVSRGMEKDGSSWMEEVKDTHREIERVKDTDQVGVSVARYEGSKGIEEVKDIHLGTEKLNLSEKNSRDKSSEKNVKDNLSKNIGRDNFRENNGKDKISEKNGFISSCAVPEPPMHTVGLDLPLQDLKMKLLRDGVSVIGLSAPGGCGKTTLAKKLCHDQQVEGKFKDNIFFVTVSKQFNLKVIVQKLLQHKGYQVPEFQSDEDAVNHLGQLLKSIGQKPILLVLDDVWPGSESLLEKFRFQLPDYKILVTSRSTFPGFGSTYSLNLKTLNDEDAITLFRYSASRQDGTSSIPDEDLLKKIVKGCKGLPLALTVVGRSLCGQPAAVWQNRVNKWSKGGSIFDSEKELLDCLRSSLDALDSKLKECYLDLGSFPENQMITANVLIDMWVELYDLDEAGVSSIANLHELSNRNLIDLIITKKDDSEVDGPYNDHFVMQHDLLRDLVKHQSNLGPIESRKRLFLEISGDEFPYRWMEQMQQPIRAILLCISTDETFSSNWRNMQVPEVEVLVLNFRTKNYTLPKFMEKMYKLKVLIVTNYGFFPAELTNLPLLGSLSSLKRIRLEQVSIPSFSMATVKLQNLQKISLVSCIIGLDFTHCKISDALPNLVEINIDYCNDVDELLVVLCDIVYLKKLIFTFCKLSALPKEIGQLVNLEVLRLISCVNFLEFPATIKSLCKLSILDISDCSRIRKLPEQIGELHNLRKLFMKGCSNCELPPSVVNLELLNDVICDEETATLWSSFKSYYHLRNLRIKVPKEYVNLNNRF